MLYILSFIYGSALGSFVNVIVTRLNVAPIVKARSKCLSCGITLSWKDLVPVFSYLYLRGKCKSCKTKYGISNLLIEIIYGVIFILVYSFILSGQVSTTTSFLWLVYYTLFFVTLGVITLYDLKHKVIPINFFFGFLALTFIVLLLRLYDDSSLYTLISPLVVASPFLLLWILSRVFNKEWLGFGDVLMFASVGAFFDVFQGLAVFFLSVWIGAITGIVLKVLESKKYNLKTAIPFVPFITISIIIVLFTDIDILSIAQFLVFSS